MFGGKDISNAFHHKTPVRAVCLPAQTEIERNDVKKIELYFQGAPESPGSIVRVCSIVV